MTKLHILSDIHDDFSRTHLGNWQIPETDADIVVVAGDVAGKMSTMGRDWLEAQHHRLGKPIVFVPGNHDFWRGSVDREIPRFRERLQTSGIHLLDGDSVLVEGIRFVGGTLWTDYAVGGDATIAMQVARTALNDFHYLRKGTGNDRPQARPVDLLAIHLRHREAIRQTLAVPFAGPTVVVTHHAPSPKSLRTGAVREPLDAAYASDLEDLILKGRPEMWIHGHVHHRLDYAIGDTRVICNPRGYVSWRKRFGTGAVDAEHEGFDEALVIDAQRRPRSIPAGYQVEEGFLTMDGIPIGPLDAALDEIEREEVERRRWAKRDELVQQMFANAAAIRAIDAGEKPEPAG
ncbi:metallophosphoesterase [Aureimonas mangrovi]|uniref:metallophosphoesterase n=1 Tax=Aureimonas mangrovi TaxID=2758041 RepID=UPI00163D5696|nr:metallophosphoesterase [Aureimonas mangrovi]